MFDKVGLFWKVGLCLINWICFGKSGFVFDKVCLFWEKVGLCVIKWVCFRKCGSVFDKVVSGSVLEKVGLCLIKWACFGKSGSVFEKVGLFWKKWVFV